MKRLDSKTLLPFLESAGIGVEHDDATIPIAVGDVNLVGL